MTATMPKILALLIAIPLLTACKTVRSADARSASAHDTLYLAKYLHDSVRVTDSVSQSEFTRGDTVFVIRYKERVRYLTRLRTDTVYKNRTDTVRVAEKTVQEKKPKRAGTIILGTTAALGVIVAIFAITAVRKK